MTSSPCVRLQLSRSLRGRVSLKERAALAAGRRSPAVQRLPRKHGGQGRGDRMVPGILGAAALRPGFQVPATAPAAAQPTAPPGAAAAPRTEAGAGGADRGAVSPGGAEGARRGFTGACARRGPQEDTGARGPPMPLWADQQLDFRQVSSFPAWETSPGFLSASRRSRPPGQQSAHLGGLARGCWGRRVPRDPRVGQAAQP